jgi:hypothetical protein
MPLKGTIPDRIREFHSGPTYAKTKAKFGAERANKQAEAVAFSSARKRKDPPMKKEHEDGMAGEKGMSPRKAMASGAMKGGSFGAEPFHEMNDGTGMHPDHAAHTGMKEHLEDHERATPPAIHHTKHHMPAQAAPRHGAHHPGNHGNWDREGNV